MLLFGPDKETPKKHLTSIRKGSKGDFRNKILEKKENRLNERSADFALNVLRVVYIISRKEG